MLAVIQATWFLGLFSGFRDGPLRYLRASIDCNFSATRTQEFIKRNGQFTVNVGLCEAGVPVLGVVGVPAAEEPRTYFAVKDGGAFVEVGDGEELHGVSSDPWKPLPTLVLNTLFYGLDHQPWSFLGGVAGACVS